MSSRFILASGILLAIVLGCGPTAAPSSVAPPSVAPSLTTATATPPPPSPVPAASPSVPASPSPAAEASVPTSWTTYRSEPYAYSIDVPADWIATPASQDWPATGSSYPDDPAVDKWVMPGGGDQWVLMFVSSVPLQPGESAKERLARLDRDNASVCQLANRQSVSVDGASGRQEDGTCFGSDYIREVMAVHDGRSYLIYILSGVPITDVGLATFDHFLSSFQFGAS